MALPDSASHPSDQLLASHASGWIAWPADLCVRVHLETCADCRRAVAAREESEAAFVESLPDAPMAPEKLAALVARLEAAAVAPAAGAKRRRLGDLALPRALTQVGIRPRRWVRPGLWIAQIAGGDPNGWRTYLLRAPAGQRLPGHSHSGPELICVLQGAFHDGRVRRAGDFVENPRHSSHRLTVTRDGPCACLIASKGPLIWRGMARLLNPLLSL